MKDFDCVLCGSCVADILVRPVPLETPIGGGKLLHAEPIEVTTGRHCLQLGHRHGPAWG